MMEGKTLPHLTFLLPNRLMAFLSVTITPPTRYTMPHPVE